MLWLVEATAGSAGRRDCGRGPLPRAAPRTPAAAGLAWARGRGWAMFANSLPAGRGAGCSRRGPLGASGSAVDGTGGGQGCCKQTGPGCWLERGGLHRATPAWDRVVTGAPAWPGTAVSQGAPASARCRGHRHPPTTTCTLGLGRPTPATKVLATFHLHTGAPHLARTLYAACGCVVCPTWMPPAILRMAAPGQAPW